MNSQLPFISIVIPTYDSQISLPDCLRSVSSQSYPKEKIEILIVDGSSDDKTQEIAGSYQTTLIKIPRHKQNAEYNKAVGFQKSKGELVLILDSDNVLPNKRWLLRMVKPFLKHQDVVGADTLYFTYNKKNSLLDRYLSLFGSLDPVAYYLNKVDKLPYGISDYTLLGDAKEFRDYFLVRFTHDAVPSIGSNGFLMRKDILLRHAKIDKNNFFHTDVHVDVIKKGFNTYAFVKENITHKTGNRNIVNFFIRRYYFLKHNLMNQRYRRHSVYQMRDRRNLILYILYSITIVKPLFDSIRGYMRIHDLAWFLHPLFCFLFFIIYSYTFVEVSVRKYFRKER